MCTYSQNNLAATWKNKQNAHAPKMVQDCVFAQSSEFQFGFKRKNVCNPGLAGSEFGQFLSPNPGRFGVRGMNWVEPCLRMFRERPVPFSELRTLAGSDFRERTGPDPGLAGSEKGQFLSPNERSGRTSVRQVRRKTGSFLRTSKKKN